MTRLAAASLLLLAALLSAEAQPAGKVQRIGFLSSSSAPTMVHEGFRQGLRELGWVEGQNIVVDYRFADGHDQLPALAAELVGLKLDIIVALATPATAAARNATGTIPIVSRARSPIIASMPALADRIAVVTGGTGALGQAITLRLLDDGATVAIPYAVEDEHTALRKRVKAGDEGRLVTEPVDVTDVKAMTAFVDRVVAARRRVDILVSAVGGFAGGGLLETDETTWRRMLDLNLTSAFAAARAVVPHMVEARWGRVVVVGSRAVVPPAGGFIGYTAAKAGVIAFAQALAQEVRGDGITVNAVLPSTMDTPANRAAMPGVDPAGWVPVESVAAAIAFLARPESLHITGTLLAV